MTTVVNVWCRQQSSLLLLGMFKGLVNRTPNFMPLRLHVFGSFLPYIRSALTFLDRNLMQKKKKNSHCDPSEGQIELSFTNQTEKDHEITQ